MPDADPKALLLRMHRGDESAAEALWAGFAPRLTAYARALLPSGCEWAAEDVVQSVFVQVLRMRRSALRGVRDGGAFLFRMTRNGAINHGRGEVREQARRRAAERAGGGSTAEPDLDGVLGLIEGLPYEQRQVLLLRYVGGLTIDQIAEALGVNRNTVASRGRLGVQRLRKEMASEKQEARDG